MPARLLLLIPLALLGLVAAPAAAPAAEETGSAPALLIRLRSIDGLVEDAKYLLTLSGKGEEANQFEGILKSQVGPDGLHGIDTTRPLGLYGVINPNNVQDSQAVLLVPIAKEKALLDVLVPFGITPKKEAGGYYSVTHEKVPFPIYFRFANKYAYITARDPEAFKKPLAPEQVFTGGKAEMAYASFRIDQIPDLIKQIAIGQMDLRFADLQEKKGPGETEAQHKLKVQILKEISGLITSLLNEGGTVSVRFGVDQQAGKLSQEWTLSGKSKSALADSFISLGKSQSQFGSLATSDSAASGLIHVALPEPLRQALVPIIKQGIQETLAKEKDEAKRVLEEKLFKALEPTLTGGELDAGFSLRGPGSSNLYTFIGGARLKDGEQLEKAIREIVQAIPAGERKELTLDAESAGAVKIHRVNPGKKLDAGARQAFGENPFYFAIRPNALLLAGGADGIQALKEAVAAQPKVSPQLQFDVALARFAPLMAKQGKAEVQAAEKAFAGANKGRDRVRITVEGGTALKVNFEIDAPVVTFFSLVDKAKKGQE